MSKPLIRAQLRRLLASISPEDRAAASRSAAQLLLTRPEFHNANSILFYLPLKDELDLLPALQNLPGNPKTLALPRFDPLTKTYTPALLSSLDLTHSNLATGPFSIPEPPPSAPPIPLNQLDFILVPGLGFDLAGRRIGRGKGFYDRLLAQTSGLKCGVALDVQLLPELPAEPHDIPVDFILTPTRWLDLRRGEN